MLRSLVFPGWGQLENGQTAKAAIIMAVESGFFASAYVELRRSDRAFEAHVEAAEAGDEEAAEAAFQLYEDRRSRAIGRFWWGAFTIMLSALDAYVDAHLRGFKAGSRPPMPETAPERPAPEGRSLSVGPVATSAGAAVAIRMSF
jgi:hypothetical protein